MFAELFLGNSLINEFCKYNYERNSEQSLSEAPILEF
jgi:hypothetical protein